MKGSDGAPPTPRSPRKRKNVDENALDEDMSRTTKNSKQAEKNTAGGDGPDGVAKVKTEVEDEQ